jgi:hypothetical protein
MYSKLLVETRLMSPKQDTSIFEEDEQLAKLKIQGQRDEEVDTYRAAAVNRP